MLLKLDEMVPNYINAYGYAIEYVLEVDKIKFLSPLFGNTLKDKYEHLTRQVLGREIYKAITSSYEDAKALHNEPELNDEDYYSIFKIATCFSPYALSLEYDNVVVIFLPMNISGFTYKDLYNRYFDRDVIDTSKEYILYTVEEYNTDLLNTNKKYYFKSSSDDNHRITQRNELSVFKAQADLNRHMTDEELEKCGYIMYKDRIITLDEYEKITDKELIKTRKKCN